MRGDVDNSTSCIVIDTCIFSGGDQIFVTHISIVPPPTLALSPDASVTLYHGDPLTVTCMIRLDPAVVDSAVLVTGQLGGPGGNSTTMLASAGVYRLTLYIHSLRATSSGTYTCTVTVKPGSRSMYVNGSESQSSIDIAVGKQSLYR